MPNLVTFDVAKSLFGAGSVAAGTTYTADQQNIGRRGIKVGVLVSADGGTGTLTVTIQGKDLVTGTYYDILSSTAVNIAAGFRMLTVYPGLAAVANVAANDVLPGTWRLRFVVATNNITANVGASILV